ncbi:unnamed protein product, partial [Staurois parvus]
MISADHFSDNCRLSAVLSSCCDIVRKVQLYLLGDLLCHWTQLISNHQQRWGA